jgi:hypothetical protein
MLGLTILNAGLTEMALIMGLNRKFEIMRKRAERPPILYAL